MKICCDEKYNGCEINIDAWVTEKKGTQPRRIGAFIRGEVSGPREQGLCLRSYQQTAGRGWCVVRNQGEQMAGAS